MATTSPSQMILSAYPISPFPPNFFLSPEPLTRNKPNFSNQSWQESSRSLRPQTKDADISELARQRVNLIILSALTVATRKDCSRSRGSCVLEDGADCLIARREYVLIIQRALRRQMTAKGSRSVGMWREGGGNFFLKCLEMIRKIIPTNEDM